MKAATYKVISACGSCERGARIPCYIMVEDDNEALIYLPPDDATMTGCFVACSYLQEEEVWVEKHVNAYVNAGVIDKAFKACLPKRGATKHMYYVELTTTSTVSQNRYHITAYSPEEAVEIAKEAVLNDSDDDTFSWSVEDVDYTAIRGVAFKEPSNMCGPMK